MQFSIIIIGFKFRKQFSMPFNIITKLKRLIQRQTLNDRDTMMNAVAASSDSHMRFIDAREDVLLTRANDWKDDTLTSCNE